MRRPPRNPTERLFSLRSIGMSLLQGASVLAIVLAVFVVARRMGHENDNARGLTFASLVTANIGLILTNRSWRRTMWSMMREPNSALWWVVGGATILLAVVLCVPWMQRLFHFAPLHLLDLLICLAAGAGSILWFEVLKICRKHYPMTN